MTRNDLESLMQDELDKIRGNTPCIQIVDKIRLTALEAKCKIKHNLIVDETAFKLLEKYNNLQMPKELPAKAITQRESTATMIYPGSWPPPKMKFPGLK